MKILLFACLFLGFSILFCGWNWRDKFETTVERTRRELEDAARRRAISGKEERISIRKEKSLVRFLEQQLCYSGLKARLPLLTPERWVLGNVFALSFGFLAGMGIWGIIGAIGVVCALLFLQWFLVVSLRMKNLKRVDANLLKFLDFLGNYSVTAGEMTSVFSQVARYMEEPIRGALELCCMEATTTGDAGAALLAMEAYIEHPKFKELARNLEISVRYCTDFSAMVAGSRRSMREYLRAQRERRGLLAEAGINLALLLIMSFGMLAVVGKLLDFSIATFLVGTVVGRIALGLICFFILLFLAQARKLQK